MSDDMTLVKLAPGERAFVKELIGTGGMRRRLLDLGLAPDTAVECLGRSPLGDPSAYLIRGAVVAIRAEDCKKIILKSNE